VTQLTFLCLFVIDFSVESHGCSIFSQMALWLLICHRSEFPNETRRRTPKKSLTPTVGSTVRKEKEMTSVYKSSTCESDKIPQHLVKPPVAGTVNDGPCELRVTESKERLPQKTLPLLRIPARESEARQFRLEQPERSAAARYKALIRISAAVAAQHDPEGLFPRLASELRRVVSFDFIGISQYDEATNKTQWRLNLSGGSDPGITDGVTTEQTLTQWVYEHQVPLVIPFLERESRFPCTTTLVEQHGIRSLYAVPLTTAHRRIGSLVTGSVQPAAYDEEDVEFLRQVANQIAITMENTLAYGEIQALKNKLAQEKLYLQDEVRSELNFNEIVGKSVALRRVLMLVETVAPTDSTVLIYGETGTGKELIARAIHNLSPRCSNAFVKLNCAAIPTGLLESELFGHEKGAFTGAIAQRIGRFELANRGSVFLDEIGEVPLDLQTKLLRVLQEREFERLGSTRTLRTDTRLIAATNRDLSAMLEEQKFRSDLFYRLNVFPIRIPALRERGEDIPMLVRHFVQHFARRMNRNIETIPSETMESLSRYSWPGNIRELENLIERAVILSPGPVLHVPLGDFDSRTTPGQVNGKHQTLEEAERAHILATLKETRWVLSGPNGAAIRLGMNRSTIQFRMKKLGIVRPGM
jgi:formate hydrogenlyase transcriptional activator